MSAYTAQYISDPIATFYVHAKPRVLLFEGVCEFEMRLARLLLLIGMGVFLSGCQTASNAGLGWRSLWSVFPCLPGMWRNSSIGQVSL